MFKMSPMRMVGLFKQALIWQALVDDNTTQYQSFPESREIKFVNALGRLGELADLDCSPEQAHGVVLPNMREQAINAFTAYLGAVRRASSDSPAFYDRLFEILRYEEPEDATFGVEKTIKILRLSDYSSIEVFDLLYPMCVWLDLDWPVLMEIVLNSAAIVQIYKHHKTGKASGSIASKINIRQGIDPTLPIESLLEDAITRIKRDNRLPPNLALVK